MSFHEDLYGRRCICYIVWFDVGEFGFIGQDLFHHDFGEGYSYLREVKNGTES